MYVAYDPEMFSWLVGVIVGFTQGYREAIPHIPGTDPSPGRLVPEGFSDFVAAHFGHKWAGGAGWDYYIRTHTANQEAAFATFFQLLTAYEAQHPNAA